MKTRFFFQIYCPKSFDHECKVEKMQNAAVVAFDLHCGRHDNKQMYRIDPKSIECIYKGFESKKKKKV